VKHVKQSEDGTPVCVKMLYEAWSILDQLLSVYGNATPVSEAFARLIKSTLTAHGKHFSSLVIKVCEKIVVLFDQTRLSAYLWITKLLVSHFMKEEAFKGVMFQLVERMIQITFTEFEQKDIMKIPDGKFIS
jgi:hypothetical protein